MNVKDIPFMFGWLFCTYIALRIFELPLQLSKSLVLRIFLLGVFTGWLMSIRISGILIILEYFWLACFWFLRNRNGKILMSIAHGAEIAGIFLIGLVITLFISYPILWHNPFEFINALAFMSSHPWLGNTLTAGKLIEPKTNLVFYIAAWQLVKLPVFVLLGLLAATYFLLRDFIGSRASNRFTATSALYFSVLSIISILILRHVALYNELRQILFIAPLLMLISIVGLQAVSRGLTIFSLAATSIFMLIDDIQLRPYQYAYINELARHTNIGKKYEAIECYDEAIKLNPEYTLCYCNRGKTYQDLSNNDKAISDFRKAKSLFDQGKLEGLSAGNISYI
jgi:tetratricopeptide (TPR) repeat protein